MRSLVSGRGKRVAAPKEAPEDKIPEDDAPKKAVRPLTVAQQTKLVVDIWKDPKTGFAGTKETLRRAKEKAGAAFTLKPADVLAILRKQEHWQLNAPKQVVQTRAMFTAAGVNSKLQADLIDMDKAGFGKFDDLRYLLTVVDVYSRYAMAVGLPDKKAKTVLAGWNAIQEEGMVPTAQLSTDEGGEFVLVAKAIPEGVKFRAETPGVHTAVAIVNAFHRTLQKRLATATRALKKTWVQVLPAVMINYNTSLHSSLGATPLDVYEGRAEPKYPGGAAGPPPIPTDQEIHRQRRLKLGTKVRIATDPGVGARPDRSFFEHWSDETFVVVSVKDFPSGLKMYYLFHPQTQTQLENGFYANELQPI
jgi:transposase InsO family protein